jgi:Tc5 transposase DNA-binding domain
VSNAMLDNILLTGEVLHQKWIRFADLVGVPKDEQLNLSDGWLAQFKTRNGLKVDCPGTRPGQGHPYFARPWPLEGQHQLALTQPRASPGPTQPHPLKKIISQLINFSKIFSHLLI